jgi:hypothetical protein
LFYVQSYQKLSQNPASELKSPLLTDDTETDIQKPVLDRPFLEKTILIFMN